jgi:protein-tyrosine phosphatase
MMFTYIMTVCTGNICRSPLAEAELRHCLPKEITICSSGLHAVVGAPAQETVQKLAERRGLDLSGHAGTQITESMVLENDLILVMTASHKEELEQQFPAARGRVFLIGEWGVGEIPDPYGCSEAIYASVDLQIQKAVEQWLPKLKK